MSDPFVNGQKDTLGSEASGCALSLFLSLGLSASSLSPLVVVTPLSV